MIRSVVWLAVTLTVLCNAGAPIPPTASELSLNLKFSYEKFTYAAIEKSAGSRINKLNNQVSLLVRQLMMQQLATEEKARSDGDSGLKKMRLRALGSRPYHTAGPIATIHDHSNNIRTVGMGEFSAILNGIEFRTRHNDYGMRKASKLHTDYHLVEDIEYPKVPDAVLAYTKLDDQIKEMREWFKAWKTQDHSVRDYRQYFKPVLSYLEGAWTTSVGSIEESFFSDRHFLDAKTWFDLQEKVRYSSYAGTKSLSENLAYLPTKIMNVINETHYEIAQWNYRILSHPLKRDLPLNRLRIIDDLDYRMATGKTIFEHERTRGARFSINQEDSDIFEDKVTSYGLLDEMMNEIPGKDNYPANLTDTSFGATAYDYQDSASKLNSGYYHRSFRAKKNDAQGLNSRRRGYHDANLFMAMTSHKKVSSLDYEYCPKSWTRVGCKIIGQRWTYAIPLEVIYMTPLQTWNPYKLQYKGDSKTALGKTVNANGRWGSTTSDLKAYNGTNSRTYYITPAAFFSSNEEGRAAGDTTKSAAGVLDRQGVLKVVKAGGIRVMLPYIAGVGSLRTRYPIMSLYEEGNSMFKHFSALQDIVLKPKSYAYMYREDTGGDGEGVTLDTAPCYDADKHIHRLTLTAYEVFLLKHGKRIDKNTGVARVADGSTLVPLEGFAHQHSLTISYSNGKYYMRKCDGMSRCTHRHHTMFTEVSKEQLAIEEEMAAL